jgi:hypothetical protein
MPDFTINAQWTRSAGLTTTAMSYTPNVQYRYDLANRWWFEPTAGFTYSQISVPGGGVNGSSLEVHGGARIGTETVWNGIRVQPQLEGIAFTLASQTVAVPGGAVAPASQKGMLGGRGAAKWSFLWSSNFSSFVEAHVRGVDSTLGFGTTGGLRWTW